jgi:hypothetical protein
MVTRLLIETGQPVPVQDAVLACAKSLFRLNIVRVQIRRESTISHR